MGYWSMVSGEIPGREGLHLASMKQIGISFMGFGA